MINLIDRMITRVQRPISPVEPLLSQLHMPRPDVFLNSGADSISPIEPQPEVRSHSINRQANASRLLIEKTVDVSPSRLFHQSFEQPSINATQHDRLSDPAIAEDPTPALPLQKMGWDLRSSQFYGQEIRRTQPQSTDNVTDDKQETPKEEYIQLINTRPATPTLQNDAAMKVREEKVRGEIAASITKNQFQPPTTTEVNISIGHIEVRAIQRIEPVRKSTSTSYVTLDDYLRRRPGAAQ
jgi:hypothetical protein